MSPLAPLFSFLMALFGVTFVAASALTSASTSSTATSTPATTDAPPAITTFSVRSGSDLHPTTIYAGLNALLSFTVTDDNGLTSVNMQTPGMRFRESFGVGQCVSNATTCSVSALAVVPDRPGSYTLTITATDNRGQVSTQTVTFTAQGCTKDAECGGIIFSGGATSCGPEGASIMDKVMKYGSGNACVDSSCTTKSAVPLVFEDCAAAGKICGFSPTNGGQFQCVTKPSVTCALNTAITSLCMCGSVGYASYGYCCKDGAGNIFQSSSACSPVGTPSSSTTSTPAIAPVPGSGAPEPSNDDVGAWAAVDIATGQITNVVVCTRAVCGINGEYHGYVPPPTWATGSVWWPTSKRYIWQVPGQAGYSPGTFNFSTYVFTVPGGTIYNGQFTKTVTTPTVTTSPTSTIPLSTYTAPTPAPTVYAPTPNVTSPTIIPIIPSSTSTPATVQPAPIAQCLQAGGVWCYTESSQSNIGYCATAVSGCGQKSETLRAEERRAELQSQERFFAERRAILQDLRAMERLVKQDVVDVDPKLLQAYKEKLLALKPDEEQNVSALQDYREKITELRGDEENAAILVVIDPRAGVKMLKEMKRGVRQFERHLVTIAAKVAKVEKAGITVETSIKEALVTAQDMAKRVKSAKTYEDIRDIADALPDVGQALNDSIPRLEELLRLPRIFGVLERELEEAERARTQTRSVAKKLKLDVTDYLAEMQALLTGAREAVATMKADTSATDDVVSVLEEDVLDKIDAIFDLAEHVKVVGSVRQAVSRAASDAKRYGSHIRRLKKPKEDTQVDAATRLLQQFNEQTAVLRELSKRKLTPDVGEQIIEQVRAMAETRGDLDNILNLSKADPLEEEIRKLFSASGEKLKQFNVEALEQ